MHSPLKDFMKRCLQLLVVSLSSGCFAQGFNNTQDFDDTDLRFLFSKNGIEAFKFPFTSTTQKSMNIVVEEYSNKQLKKTIHFYNDFKPLMKLFDEPLSYFFPPLQDSIAQVVRFYLIKKKSNLFVTIKTSTIEREYKFTFKAEKLTQSRAFDYIPISLSKREPLLVYYGNKNTSLIACPGDAPVASIVNMYDRVIIFYAEILELR